MIDQLITNGFFQNGGTIDVSALNRDTIDQILASFSKLPETIWSEIQYDDVSEKIVVGANFWESNRHLIWRPTALSYRLQSTWNGQGEPIVFDLPI